MGKGVPGGSDIVSPLARPGTGQRLLPKAGNVSLNRDWTLRDLPDGEYEWWVQAVDNVKNRSAFRTVGQTLTIPVKHGEGAWYADDALYEELVALDQIVLRYEDNPNGSLHDVAGVCNREGNVLGLMPHPEHAIDPLLGPADGAFVIASLVDAAREREQALV